VRLASKLADWRIDIVSDGIKESDEETAETIEEIETTSEADNKSEESTEEKSETEVKSEELEVAVDTAVESE